MQLSNILRNAFRLYQGTFLIHSVGTLLLSTIVLLLYMGLLPIIFGMPTDALFNLLNNEPQKLFSIIERGDFQIKFWLFILLIDCIMTPYTAGFYNNFALLKKNERPTLGGLFTYFRSSYTGRILNYVFFLISIKIFISVGFSAIGFESLGMAMSIILSLVFTLTIPIIIFENMPLLSAMKASTQRILPQLFTAFVVLSLGIVIAISGLFLFGIGVALTFSFLYTVIYSIYSTYTTERIQNTI